MHTRMMCKLDSRRHSPLWTYSWHARYEWTTLLLQEEPFYLLLYYPGIKKNQISCMRIALAKFLQKKNPPHSSCQSLARFRCEYNYTHSILWRYHATSTKHLRDRYSATARYSRYPFRRVFRYTKMIQRRDVTNVATGSRKFRQMPSLATAQDVDWCILSLSDANTKANVQTCFGINIYMHQA